MARILALDMGKVRIGVAVSDETETIATPLENIKVAGVNSTIKKIDDIVTQYKADRVVVGLPLKMNGEIGTAAQGVLDFIDKLKETLNIPVLACDERLTTKEAQSVLIEADMSRSKRRQSLDSLAAVIMLQAYLDSKNNERRAEMRKR